MSFGGLVGRDADLHNVEERTRAHRLVTIVGPGGVGKTTLARAAAARLAPSYPLGVREIDLVRIDDESAVPGAIAAQLGFDSFDALLSSPGDQPVLVVVDNCEHVLDACATSVARMLGACHQPVVIATSRAPLELPGESVVSLPPLAVPRTGADPSDCASVQLFLRRARDAGADVTAQELETAAELCRRLDGLPLAIEIAAARARTMSVAEIVARLADTIEVLDRPRFRGDPRHRSIAETVRWSHDLLRPDQARLFERLAVFAGPFTAESGRAVAGQDSPSFDADLDELVNASLVAVDDRIAHTRYRLLDTVRRFALDQLTRRGDLAQAYDGFVNHVLASVRHILDGSATSWRPTIVRDLQAHFDDMAEALAYAIAHDETPDRAYRICGILWAIVHQGHADDIVILCRRTLERWPADGSATAARAVAALATAEYVTGHADLAARLSEAAIAQLRRPSDAAVTLHRSLGQSRRALGDPDGALETFRRGASIGHDLGLTAMAMELDIAAAIVRADAGDVDAAITELRAVIEQSDSVASVITSSWGRTSLGWIELRRDPVLAPVTIEGALAEAREIDYSIAIAVGLRSLAYAHLLGGRHERAAATVRELLDDLIRRGALSNVRVLADVAAATAYRCDHPSWERLAVSARSLPITTLAAATFELIPLPETTALPFPRSALVAAIRQVLDELPAGAQGPTGTTRDDTFGRSAPAAVGRIVRRGDLVEFVYGGRTVAIRATKGLDDIVRLIEAGGTEIHCLDLAGAAAEQASTGETIDATARRRYEERIRDLQGDIDEAEANSDFELAYRHQNELDQLIDHLSAAIGHGNRTRRAAGSAERARSAVTHRVRGTIRQITKLQPQLGAHLAHSINTGTYCSYRPERPIAWEFD